MTSAVWTTEGRREDWRRKSLQWLTADSSFHWVKYPNNVRCESDLFNMSFRSATSQKYGTFSDSIRFSLRSNRIFLNFIPSLTFWRITVAPLIDGYWFSRISDEPLSLDNFLWSSIRKGLKLGKYKNGNLNLSKLLNCFTLSYLLRKTLNVLWFDNEKKEFFSILQPFLKEYNRILSYERDHQIYA